MSARRRTVGISLVAAALLLGGCGTVSDDEVRKVATTFAATHDADTRCALLAPATVATLTEQESSTCPDAIGKLRLGSGRPVAVQVWGEEAQVKLTDDTLFLTRTPHGWRVMAAGCRFRNEQRPYDCQLEGS